MKHLTPLIAALLTILACQPDKGGDDLQPEQRQLSTPELSLSNAKIGTFSFTLSWDADPDALSGYQCTVTEKGMSTPVFNEILKDKAGVIVLEVKGLKPVADYKVEAYAIATMVVGGGRVVNCSQSETAVLMIETKDQTDEPGTPGTDPEQPGTDPEQPGTDPEKPDQPDQPGTQVGQACPKWFELPAQKDEDRNGIDDDNADMYYSWTRRSDAPKIRNFSAGYSKSKVHPVWVAAPMHDCYTGGSGRTDAYKNDPAIACEQSAKFEGYTRGHMLGSSDRTVSKPTNQQVFYYSNIGAQLQDNFNTGGGAWNNLEALVDDLWCADTLYQVVGCIFESFTDRYGKTVNPKTTTNPNGSRVQVPTAWYKVLLRTKSGRSGKRVDECSASELKCCAFILRHSSDNSGHKPTSKDLYSVEDVEKLTGLTFFVNVPNAPKSTCTASDWGL